MAVDSIVGSTTYPTHLYAVLIRHGAVTQEEHVLGSQVSTAQQAAIESLLRPGVAAACGSAIGVVHLGYLVINGTEVRS